MNSQEVDTKDKTVRSRKNAGTYRSTELDLDGRDLGDLRWIRGLLDWIRGETLLVVRTAGVVLLVVCLVGAGRCLVLLGATLRLLEKPLELRVDTERFCGRCVRWLV